MTAAEVEKQRLEVLESYNILDTPPEKEYDDIAEMASSVCNTPVALVSFIGAGQSFFKARVGLPDGFDRYMWKTEMERLSSMCGEVVFSRLPHFTISGT